jgi:hypothetical protein
MVTRYGRFQLRQLLAPLGGGFEDVAGEIADRLPIRLVHHATLHC